MRLLLAGLVVVLTASVAAFAEDKPAPVTAKKPPKEIKMDGETVEGKRPTPVQLVLTRDQSIKRDLGSETDQHIMDSARLDR